MKQNTKGDRAMALEKLSDQVTAIMQNIDSMAVEKLDFDSLREILGEVLSAEREKARLNSELSELKHDYRKRILGMLKALLVCRHDDEDRIAVGLLTDQPDTLASKKIIKLYLNTAAKFRKQFPASYDYLRQVSANDLVWREHKI